MKALLVGLFAALSSITQANELNALNKYGEPAMIELVAASATISMVNGKSTLTLNEVDKLAGIISSIHKVKRSMDAFPVSEFSDAWNSCNAMKEEKKLWSRDGFNSILIFHTGSDANPKNTHLAKAPLITVPKDATKTLGGDEGIAKLMLINAKMINKSLSFDIKGGNIAVGNYQRIRVLTECVVY